MRIWLIDRPGNFTLTGQRQTLKHVVQDNWSVSVWGTPFIKQLQPSGMNLY